MRNPNDTTEYKLQFRSEAPNVDLDGRTISNVILCQAGEAKGHGEHIEEPFLADLVTFAQANFPEGLPCHFGHNWDNLGKQLGKIDNIRLEEGKVKGDLNVYESADDSPVAKNMGKYVLKLAAEDEKAINLSIVFRSGGYYQKNEAGETEDVGIDAIDYDKPLYVKFKELLACDVVDRGAVTDTLYTEESDSVLNKIKKLVGIKPSTKVQELTESLSLVRAKLSTYKSQIEHVIKQNNRLQTELSEKDALIATQLQTITTLSLLPADPPTPDPIDPPQPPEGPKGRSFEANPINKKVKSKYLKD